MYEAKWVEWYHKASRELNHVAQEVRPSQQQSDGLCKLPKLRDHREIDYRVVRTPAIMKKSRFTESQIVTILNDALGIQQQKSSLKRLFT